MQNADVTQNPKRLFVDMAGTLARFHSEVDYLERMFEKDFFLQLKPYDHMVAAIKEFMAQHPDVEVYILSSTVIGEPPYCQAEKHEWLDKYLPEIDAQHRLFPTVGQEKAAFVPGGVTKNDYLIDDYNRSLLAFEAAGGSTIKCHNDINQKGLGVWGGEVGQIWVGPMVHLQDNPAMIAGELSQHMGLNYDLGKAIEPYGVKIVYPDGRAVGAPDDEHPIQLRADMKGIIWPSGEVRSAGYGNPLNAARACGKTPDRDFAELPIIGSNSKMIRPTLAEIRYINSNIGVDPGFLPDSINIHTVWSETAERLMRAHVSLSIEQEDEMQRITKAVEEAAERILREEDDELDFDE